MDRDFLNVELIRQLREKCGNPEIRWLIKHVGVGFSSGYQMFRIGTLPKNPTRRKVILQKLATYFGVDEHQLIVRLEAKTA